MIDTKSAFEERSRLETHLIGAVGVMMLEVGRRWTTPATFGDEGDDKALSEFSRRLGNEGSREKEGDRRTYWRLWCHVWTRFF